MRSAVERAKRAAKIRIIKIAKVFAGEDQAGRTGCFLFGGKVADDSRLACTIPEHHGVAFARLIAVGAVEEERFAGEHGGAESMDVSQRIKDHAGLGQE